MPPFSPFEPLLAIIELLMSGAVLTPSTFTEEAGRSTLSEVKYTILAQSATGPTKADSDARRLYGRGPFL